MPEKYLSKEIVVKSLEMLQVVHPFFGITFLVFKKNELPIGETTTLSIDSLEREFMDEYYKPFSESAWYLRVFRPNDRKKKWLDPKYPGSGSQSTRTRGRIAQALIHDTNHPLVWGWKTDYVTTLTRALRNDTKVPAFYLGVWLYHNFAWNSDVHPHDVVDRFIREFHISDDEAKSLLALTIPEDIIDLELFADTPVTAQSLIPEIGIPRDMPQEGGGILSYLELRGVGPANELKLEPGRRINLITGDNGLGKTFLLETAWWALTGYWISYPADPTNNGSGNAIITFRVAGEYTESDTITISYDPAAFNWPIPSEKKASPSLLVYACADSSFAVWDPAQHLASRGPVSNVRPFVFSPTDVWFGLEDSSRRSISEGLLRDWVTWQSNNTPEFHLLTKVLKLMSPNDLGDLKPGRPTRLPGERRLIPTLSLPYGDVAVTYASEGMRRILALAYLLVWAWSEHRTASELAHIAPQRRLVILIDEIEAHLHPKWQRLILPALVQVQAELSIEVEVQFLIATHSPLVLASVEPIFDQETDKIFNLELATTGLFGKTVVLTEFPFVRFGAVDAWLTSDVFDLGQPRSTEAEHAMQDAAKIQLEDQPDKHEIQSIHQRLVKLLPADDEFWPRWLYFAETHGVKV